LISKRMRIPVIAIFIAILIAVIFPEGTIFSQADTIQMSAFPAYSGNFKYGEWLPIWVTLENQGENLDGEVRVQVQSSEGLIAYATSVSLPSGSRKRFPLYILPNNFSRELDVQLISQKKVIKKQAINVHPQANIAYLIGLIAPERGALTLLNGITFSGQDRQKVLVDLNIDDIPVRSEALRSLDLIILNNTDTSKLLPEQSAALSEWVQQGGQLVIGGGSGAQKRIAGLSELLKIGTFERSFDIQAEELLPISHFANDIPLETQGAYIVAKVTPSDGVKIIAGDEKLPFVIQKTVGAGLFQFIALDLSIAPFDGWSGTSTFWETLVGTYVIYPTNMPYDVSPRQYRANSLFYSLSNIPSLDLPSIKWIIVILIIYIILVGPINYFVLRWQKKMHLAWITIPTLTALFTAGSCGVGYSMRGNDLVLNKIALVIASSGDNASVTSYMGLFSPRQQDYEVVVDGQGLLSPMSGYETSSWTGQTTSSGGEMVFLQDQPATVKGLTVNQWSMHSFMAEGNWHDFGHFTSDLSLVKENLVGIVRNDTQYTVSDAVVVLNNRFVRLGDMKPGEEKSVDIGLAELQSDRFGPPLSYRLFQENYTNDGTTSRLVELKTNIVSSVLENTSWTKSLSSNMSAFGTNTSNMNAFLIGWLDQAPPEVQVRGSTLSYQTTTMVYSDLQYHLPTKGYIAFPTGLIPGTATEIPMNTSTCGLPASVSMGRGEAKFEFQIPEELPVVDFENIKLSYWRDSTGQDQPPEVSLYQWEEEAWLSIQDTIQGTNIIANANQFIDQNGLIRIRIKSESDIYACHYLDLGIDGEIESGNGE